MSETWTGLPTRQLLVYPAEAFRVSHGVNEGDGLADAAELIPEDRYALSADAEPRALGISFGTDNRLTLTPGSQTGHAGAPVFLDSLVTFMSALGDTLSALILVEVDPDAGTIAQVYLHPFGTLDPAQDYALVTIDRDGAARALAEAASVSFTRGTAITMADGRQVPVEDLRQGDRVLTRDSGAQEVRWVGTQTVRAEGPFAPVRIEAGALNNAGDLVVSPTHRLFIYQRVPALGGGNRELLVKAGLLVNGTTVTQVPGGHVDYVQVLFDKHEVIFAEGIAAESLFVDRATHPALPAEIAAKLTPERASDMPLGAVELSAGEVAAQRDMVDLLRRISAA